MHLYDIIIITSSLVYNGDVDKPEIFLDLLY